MAVFGDEHRGWGERLATHRGQAIRLRVAQRLVGLTFLYAAVVGLRWLIGLDNGPTLDLFLAVTAVGLVMANLVGLFALAEPWPNGRAYATESLEID